MLPVRVSQMPAESKQYLPGSMIRTGSGEGSQADGADFIVPTANPLDESATGAIAGRLPGRRLEL